MNFDSILLNLVSFFSWTFPRGSCIGLLFIGGGGMVGADWGLPKTKFLNVIKVDFYTNYRWKSWILIWFVLFFLEEMFLQPIGLWMDPGPNTKFGSHWSRCQKIRKSEVKKLSPNFWLPILDQFWSKFVPKWWFLFGISNLNLNFFFDFRWGYSLIPLDPR